MSLTRPLLFGALGFLAQTFQVVCFREGLFLSDGSELAVALVMAVWLTAGALGAALGTWLSPGLRRPGRAAAVTLAAAGVTALPGACLLALGRCIVGAATGVALTIEQLGVVMTLSVLVPGVCLGLTVLLVVEWYRRRQEQEDALSLAYVVEALGAAAGGAVTTFVLLGFLNTLETAWLAGLVCLALAVPLHSGPGRLDGRAVIAAAGLVLLVGGWWAIPHVDQLRWERLLPGHELEASLETPLGNSAILRDPGSGRKLHLQMGHLETTLEEPDLAAGEAAFLFALAPRARQVLILGGGCDGVLEELLRGPLERLDLIEWDLRSRALVLQHLDPDRRRALTQDPRLRVHEGDPVSVALPAHTYDLILQRGASPTTLAGARLFALEWYRRARTLLRGGGVLVLSLPSLPCPEGTALERELITLVTLHHAFPHVRVTPGSTRTFVASGQAAAISLDPTELTRRLESSGYRSPWFLPEELQQLLPPADTAAIQERLEEALGCRPPMPPPGVPDLPPGLLTSEELLLLEETRRQEEGDVAARRQRALRGELHGSPLLSTLVHPRAHLAEMRYRRQEALQGQVGLLDRLLQLPAGLAWWLPILLALVALTPVLHARGRRGRSLVAGGVLLLTLGSGFWGLGAELLVLSWFQASRGILYGHIGFLVGLFMLGLALGGGLGRSLHRRQSWSRLTVAVALGLAAPLSMFGVEETLQGGSTTLFAGLQLGVGLLVGLAFAGTVAVALEGRVRPGLAYVGDLVGALLGAVLLLPWYLPAAGLMSTRHLLATCLAVCLVVGLLLLAAGDRLPGGSPSPE